MTPAEIGRLLAECENRGYEELGTLIRLSLQTSADRGVLLAGTSPAGKCRGLLVRDVRITENAGSFRGEVYLFDTKTEGRSRTVPITDRLCREIKVLMFGKDAEDPVFDIRYNQLDYPWHQVREAAGLKHVRWKDLRAQVSIYGPQIGIPQVVLQRTMGHSDEAMTRRYQQHAATLSAAQAEAIETAMYDK